MAQSHSIILNQEFFVRLGVNIDHVATVREARQISEPDPVAAAVLVDLAGAYGIVCHLREDRRHIKDRDVYFLREIVKSHLNLEMAATEEMVKIAIDLKPDMVTLVPEKREEVTTEGGLEVAGKIEHIRETVSNLKKHRIVTSLFIEPDIKQIKASARVQADYVELHTGRYANCQTARAKRDELDRIQAGALAAAKLGLGVSAGHGLNYHNVQEIVKIREIEELNIGHSIIGRAIFTGLQQAVREMVELIK
ncbi:MAG: pyridoxine 5'-phosphate synthase [Deferribacteres bacterium]|nr:pyridoxine 5'-phosphate synthase [candidate division KSB1 bacterium]MCB9504266.1 pyridoxine 5'-phosphate synthase [Deferribacteres bacterium]